VRPGFLTATELGDDGSMARSLSGWALRGNDLVYLHSVVDDPNTQDTLPRGSDWFGEVLATVQRSAGH
jgi:hypothetical protein